MKTLKIHADERKKRMEFLNVLVPYPLEEQQTLEVNPISSEEGFGVEVIDGESKEVFIYSSKGTSKCETKLFRYQNEELIEVIEL